MFFVFSRIMINQIPVPDKWCIKTQRCFSIFSFSIQPLPLLTNPPKTSNKQSLPRLQHNFSGRKRKTFRWCFGSDSFHSFLGFVCCSATLGISFYPQPTTHFEMRFMIEILCKKWPFLLFTLVADWHPTILTVFFRGSVNAAFQREREREITRHSEEVWEL